MSEYQYYEFQAIDHSLDEAAMTELHGLSSRADLTPTSFVNVYNYGDFRGDPRRLMEKYFDAFLYIANWGTHRLMIRLPHRLVDAAAVRRYCVEDHLSVYEKGEHILLDFRSEEEDGQWEEQVKHR